MVPNEDSDRIALISRLAARYVPSFQGSCGQSFTQQTCAPQLWSLQFGCGSSVRDKTQALRDRTRKVDPELQETPPIDRELYTHEIFRNFRDLEIDNGKELDPIRLLRSKMARVQEMTLPTAGAQSLVREILETYPETRV